MSPSLARDGGAARAPCSDLPMPSGGVSISPVTDLRCEAETFKTNAKKDIAPLGSWDTWTKLYIGETNPLDPILSPLMSELHSLPPLYFCVGTHEIHLDDTVNFAKKAKASGVTVEIKIWDRMIHAFPILSPLFPEAKKAMHEICNFMNKVVK